MSTWQSMRLVAGRELRETHAPPDRSGSSSPCCSRRPSRRCSCPSVLGRRRHHLPGRRRRAARPSSTTSWRRWPTSLDVEVELSSADSMPSASQQVADDEVDVAIVVGGQPTVIAEQDRADSFVATVQQVVGVQALAGAARGEGARARRRSGRRCRTRRPKVVRLDQDRSSRQASAAIVATLLYLLLLMLMILVANGVAIEKANRISEVLLAIVRPGPLLFGKVIGVGLVGIAHPGHRGCCRRWCGCCVGGDLPGRARRRHRRPAGRGSCSASCST